MPDSTASAVGFHGVRFAWSAGSPPCLDVETFEVARGERVFIHGPSGSGKSTLLSLIGGVIEPQQGRVSVLGQNLNALGRGARDAYRATHIGFIFQLFNLLPYLSVLDNIVLPCRFSSERAARAGGRPYQAAAELAVGLGLDVSVHQRPASELSVGQQQRVACARALIGSPELVIADEPTSALDAGHQRAFLDLLLRSCETTDSTLLFVSHDQRLSAEFDRCVALAQINRAAQGGA